MDIMKGVGKASLTNGKLMPLDLGPMHTSNTRAKDLRA